MSLPTVSFKTVGCRLNQAETEMLARRFESAGYKVVAPGAPSDIVVIHSCTVTSVAERKSIRYARSAASRTSRPFVVIAGCACEVNRDEVLRASGADMAVGQDNKLDLPDLLPATLRRKAQPAASSAPSRKTRTRRTRTIIKVQDGCDCACAYCVVPRARGLPQYVPFEAVVTAAKEAAMAGFREIILTGANLGTYRDGKMRLANIIQAIETLPAIDRIRLSSIEPGTGEREIIDMMAGSTKLCRFLHLPLQSGDDRILNSMGRRYTTAEYRDLVDYAVSKVDHVGIGTDVIVGLPGEDDRSFKTTFAFVQEMPFSKLHLFPYSKRPGTRAATMPDQVPRHIAKQRVALLTALGETKQHAFAQSFVGQDVSVLVEKAGMDGAGSGWTSEYVEARPASPGIRRNDIVSFTVSAVERGVLRGEAAGRTQMQPRMDGH